MDLTPYAKRLDVDVAALEAVVRVESSGSGFSNGRPLIRFEVHRFWTGVPKSFRPHVDTAFRVKGPKPWEGHECLLNGKWVPMHQPGPKGQTLEWRCLEVAKAIDNQVAIESTSWGLGQVLGAGWKVLGFPTVHDFEAAQRTEAGQLDTMVRFIHNSVALTRAIQEHNWRMVARIYNGIGQVDLYAAKLEAAYEAIVRRGVT